MRERESLLSVQAKKWTSNIYRQNHRWSEKNSRKRSMVESKWIHTIHVEKAGLEIVDKLGWTDKKKELAMMLTYLHDVARPLQAIMTETFSDTSGNFNHSEIGANMVAIQYPEFPGKSEVVEAIYWHACYKPEIKTDLISFIRDADKYGILKHLDFYINNKLFTDYLPRGDISSEVADAFEMKQPLNYQMIRVKSPADVFVSRMAWMFDLNFPETQQLFIENSIPSQMIALLNQYQTNSNNLDRIVATMSEWQHEVVTTT